MDERTRTVNGWRLLSYFRGAIPQAVVIGQGLGENNNFKIKSTS